MAYINFIEFYNSKDIALTERLSPQIDFYEVRGIQILPNNNYKYIQTTNSIDGIYLEDWKVFIVEVCSEKQTEITDCFLIENVFKDTNGKNQFTWSLKNIPYDFGFKMVYLKIEQQVGELFYSNLFQITKSDSEKTTRIDYKNNASDTMQSIQLKMWYWQTLKNQELKSYYEVSTKNTVTNVIKSQRYEKWITESISNSLFLKITDIFEYKYVYINLYRCNLFENIEIIEHSGKQNFARNTLKISFNRMDVFNPNEKEKIISLHPEIILKQVVVNGVSAIHVFELKNFTPDTLTFQASQDQITWGSKNLGSTSPQITSFNGVGTWYFRIIHPEAESNVVILGLGDQLVAVDDQYIVSKGSTTDFPVIINDKTVGDVVITDVTDVTNGSVSIVDNGTKIRYINDGTIPPSSSEYFTYTISNGITTDSAAVFVFVHNTKTFVVNPHYSYHKVLSCSFPFDKETELFFIGDGDIPTIGDTIYTDPSALHLFDGGNYYRAMLGGKSIKITPNGIVYDIQLC